MPKFDFAFQEDINGLKAIAHIVGIGMYLSVLVAAVIGSAVILIVLLFFVYASYISRSDRKLRYVTNSNIEKVFEEEQRANVSKDVELRSVIVAGSPWYNSNQKQPRKKMEDVKTPTSSSSTVSTTAGQQQQQPEKDKGADAVLLPLSTKDDVALHVTTTPTQAPTPPT